MLNFTESLPDLQLSDFRVSTIKNGKFSVSKLMIYGGSIKKIHYLIIFNEVVQGLSSLANYTNTTYEKIDSNGIYFNFVPLYVDLCDAGYVFTYFGKLLSLF